MAKSKEDQYAKNSGICDLACRRGLLIAINFVFLLGGGAALAIGVWTVMMKMQYVPLLGTAYYNIVVFLLIGSGILVLITGIIGCVGAVRKRGGLLTTYFILLLIIFLCEIVAAIIAFVYHDSLTQEIEVDLVKNMNKNYNEAGQEAFTKAVDEMQQNFQCCGVASYSDWQNSKFIKTNEDGLKTPESCCKSPSPGCSVRDHPSNIYRVLHDQSMGCLVKLEYYLQEHIFILAVTCIVVAGLEVFAMLFTCWLRTAIRKEEEEEVY